MSEWQAKTIDSLCHKVTSGGTPSRANPSFYIDGTIPWIKTGELNGWYIDNADEWITEEAIEKSSAKLFPPETVLMAMYGQGNTITTVAILRNSASTNQACCAMIVNEEVCHPHYLLYSLKYQKEQLLKLAFGASQRNLSVTTISKFEISVPPLDIQRRIAAILSAYDDLIENNTQRIKALERAAHDLYREWFVEFRFPGYESVPLVDSGTEYGRIPQGWQVLPVSQAIEINPRIAVVKDAEKPFVEMARLSESSMLIDTGDMEFRTSNNGSKFQNYDTLFARITPCLENGKTGYVNFLANGDVALGSTEFVVMRSRTLTPEYVYCLSRLSDFRAAAQKTMTGASGRQRVQNTFFDSYLVVQPSQDVLNEFQEIVAPLFDQISVLAQKNDALREARDLLLPRLVSGELDVSEIEMGDLS